MRTWYGSQNRSAPDYNFRSASCDSKATLDVNGDVYVRNRVNINDMDSNKIIGTWIAEPHIFYDTRNIDVLYRDPDNSSRILVKSETRPFQNIINEYPGVVEGTVNYVTAYRGFEFVGTGKITNILANGTLNQEVMRTSFWINLQNEQSTYTTSNIFTIKNINTLATSVTCQITSNNIQITYENTVNSPFTFTCPYSLQRDTWYNIQVQLPGGSANVPQAVADSDPDPVTNESLRRSYVGVWVNTVAQALTLNGTAVTSDLSALYLDFILGGNTDNIIVGMFMHWTGYAFEDLTYPTIVNPKLLPIQNAYKYGPPSEMLKVGGDAVVTGKLGVGVANPTNALEVVGNINFTGDLYNNGSLVSFVAGDTTSVTNLTTKNGSTSASTTGNQIIMGYDGTDQYAHVIKTRHNTTAAAGNAIDFYTWKYGTDTANTIGTQHVMTLDGNGRVGIGVTNPTSKLDMVGTLSLDVSNFGVKMKLTPLMEIGNQSNAMYFRVDVNERFFFYDGGLHSNTEGNPGIGGTTLFTIKKGGNVSHDILLVQKDFFALTNCTVLGNYLGGLSTGWTGLNFQSGWANYGSGFNSGAYRRSITGRVYLRGLISSGTVGIVANLPVGFRPAATELFGVHAGGGGGRIDIATNGDIIFASGNNGYVQLDGLTFDSVQ